jgi:hypothetical protein
MLSERNACIQSSLLRTIVFFDVLGYAPTWVECTSWLEWEGDGGLDRQAPPTQEELLSNRDILLSQRKIEYAFGRIALHGRLSVLATLLADRMPYMARKLRHARKAASWILRSADVRFIALVNTTALGSAREEGDLDFFIIVKQGSIWSTRLLAGFPYRLLGRLSGKDAMPDAICLSYFISDRSLDLSSHILQPDDPYYRYWFCSMLPLYDDGISEELWNQNAFLRRRHPFAPRWEIAPDLKVRAPRIRIPAFSFEESIARGFQMGWFPNEITDRMNRDTSVMVSDSVLKFHIEDGRETYRQQYLERLKASYERVCECSCR